MKYWLSIVALGIGIVIGFMAGSFAAPKMILEDYNNMASDNFQTALALFRNGYDQKQIMLFGEDGDNSNFQVNDYSFYVIPSDQTTDNPSETTLNKGLGNTAAHLNGMVVMLVSKWIQDNNPNADELYSKLIEHIPNFKVSAPDIAPVKVKDLKKNRPMMESEASQWQWRMGSN